MTELRGPACEISEKLFREGLNTLTAYWIFAKRALAISAGEMAKAARWFRFSLITHEEAVGSKVD